MDSRDAHIGSDRIPALSDASFPRGATSGYGVSERTHPGSYITGIDGLRAVAVLSVIAYHLDNDYLPGGFGGVDVFFVISGFVVSMATSKLKAENFREIIFSFYRRRILRIAPAALLFIVLTQFLAVLFIPFTTRLTVPDMTAAAATVGASNIILWLKSADYFSPATILNPFTHTWSLSVEEQFYLAFPALAFLIWVRTERISLQRIGISIVAVSALFSLILAALFTARDHSFAFYMLPTRFWEMAVGFLLFLALSHDRTPRALLQPGALAVSVLSVAGLVVLLASLAMLKPDDFPFPNALAPVFSSAVLIYLVTVSPNSFLSRALSNPFFAYIGKISYSLYLWHWAVIVLMLWTFGLETPVQILIATALTFVLADLSYRLVERPVRANSWLSRLPSWQIVLAGIGAAGAAGAIVVGLTVLRPKLSLSVSSNADVWLPNSFSDEGACAVDRTRSPFAGIGTRYEFIASDCGIGAEYRRLYVVGDSHAWGYQRMTGNIARDHNMSGTVIMAAGCAVLPEPVPSNQKPQCDAYVEEALDFVAEGARPGDMLFLPGLRAQRYRDYWQESFNAPQEAIDHDTDRFREDIARLGTLLDAGVQVVIEAPKPVYNYAPFRCADWFNRTNPHCRAPVITAEEQQARRAATMRMLEQAKLLEPRIEIWDPFLLLCPDESCPAVRDGNPIVSDGDHLTGHANDLLTPYFWDAVRP